MQGLSMTPNKRAEQTLRPIFGYGTTNVGYGTTNADAGVGIGMKRGDSKKLIEKAIN